MKDLECKAGCDDFVISYAEQADRFRQIHEKEPTENKVMDLMKEALVKHYFEWHIPYELTREERIEKLKRWMPEDIIVDKQGNFGLRRTGC